MFWSRKFVDLVFCELGLFLESDFLKVILNNNHGGFSIQTQKVSIIKIKTLFHVLEGICGVTPKSKFSWKKKMSDLGSPSTQHDLAGVYQRGEGVKKDNAIAASLFLKSAKKGHHHAKYDTSINYYYGRGVKKNRDVGLFWAKKAAGNNNAFAHLNSGKWL